MQGDIAGNGVFVQGQPLLHMVVPDQGMGEIGDNGVFGAILRHGPSMLLRLSAGYWPIQSVALRPDSVKLGNNAPYCKIPGYERMHRMSLDLPCLVIRLCRQFRIAAWAGYQPRLISTFRSI